MNVFFMGYIYRYVYVFNHSRISSVVRALDCRAAGHLFDSQDRTNTQGLKMTEK